MPSDLKRYFLSFLLLTTGGAFAQNNDSLTMQRISNEVMLNGKAYDNLRRLCKEIGPRLSGSANAAKAVEATAQMLRDAGADTVYLQRCMVPHWVRGEKEKATARYKGGRKNLNVCSLGGSVGTGGKTLTAEVIEVQSFYELEKMKPEDVKGKIVFFNYPMKQELIEGGYGDAVRYRVGSPVAAAKMGAVASMIRSVTYAMDDNPHTGTTRYNDTFPKIPALACSTNDAVWLSNVLKEQKIGVRLSIKTNSETLPDVESYNVVGEIRGTEKPEDIITAGGHLDSWDLAEGAHDDGTGCMQAVEMIRTMKALSLKPKRTIRAVLFMNEENGTRGGNKYAELAQQNGNKMLFAIESDAGGFGCPEIGISGTPAQEEKVKTWLRLFTPYGVLRFPHGGGGTDISPLKPLGTMLASVDPDSQRYFDYHHAPNDVFENVNKRELNLGAIGMTGMVWLVSEYGL